MFLLGWANVLFELVIKMAPISLSASLGRKGLYRLVNNVALSVSIV